MSKSRENEMGADNQQERLELFKQHFIKAKVFELKW